MLPRRTDQGSFNDTDWATFNSLFASNAASYSDAQIDMAAVFPDETDTTFYPDQIHLNAAGNVVAANTVKATLDALIAAE
jgi:lysophospholipase L1-like esterase